MRMNLRLEDDVAPELDRLSEVYHMNKTELLNNLIRIEYHRLDTDPKVQETLEKVRYLREEFDKMSRHLNGEADRP